MLSRNRTASSNCASPVNPQNWDIYSTSTVYCIDGSSCWFLAGCHAVSSISVWQGVTMDSVKFHPGPPCPTLLRPAGGPPQGWPACRVGGLRQSYTPLDTPRHAPMAGCHAVSSCHFYVRTTNQRLFIVYCCCFAKRRPSKIRCTVSCDLSSSLHREHIKNDGLRSYCGRLG
jgi:hypothetical protein